MLATPCLLLLLLESLLLLVLVAPAVSSTPVPPTATATATATVSASPPSAVRLSGNESELLAVMSLQAAASLPHLSASLATAVRASISSSSPTSSPSSLRAVTGLFAQQAGVQPQGDSKQLPNFGALRPWPEILSLLETESEHEKESSERSRGGGRQRLLLVMIRHGEAWENLNPLPNSACEFEYEGKVIQNFDSDLSDTGREQAEQLNELLRKEAAGQEGVTWFEAMGLNNQQPILSSPLTRTLQTAKRALASLPVPRVVATEIMRASIGTDVCNYRRSVLSPTSLHSPAAPYSSGCALPSDSLTEIYCGNSSDLVFEFPVRPPGGNGFGLFSDEELLWRSDIEDQSHQTRALAFLLQLFDEKAMGSGVAEENTAVVGIVTHGEMIRAVYEAVGEVSYNALNTQVVPLMIELVQ